MHSYIARTLLAAAMLMAIAPRLSLADVGLDRFFGEYRGQAVQPAGELSPRDIGVRLRPHEKGFTLDWTTVIYHSGGPKHVSYSIDFSPTERPNVFGSAMHKDVFGYSGPLDPLKGEPYVWARIAGSTLTVYCLLIADDGGYEIQTFERTLTADGMDLRFARHRDGKRLPPITGTLKRVTK